MIRSTYICDICGAETEITTDPMSNTTPPGWLAFHFGMDDNENRMTYRSEVIVCDSPQHLILPVVKAAHAAITRTKQRVGVIPGFTTVGTPIMG